MNTAMLLHLVRKDLYYRAGTVATLWGLLLVYVCIPLLEGWTGASWVTNWLHALATLGVVLLMMTLQVDFLQADHPRATDAFLHTRPVARQDFTAAKYLAWILAAAGPALLAVALRLALHRLDLRAEDYARVLLRDAVLMMGLYGFLAMIAAVIRARRLAVSLSILSLLLLGMTAYASLHDTLWDNLSEVAREFWVDEKSRLFATWAFTLGSGHLLAGALLARARAGTGLLLILAAGLVCVAVRFAWPVNLVWRDERVLVHDGSLLHDVQHALKLDLEKEVKVRHGSGPSVQEGGVEHYGHGASCMALINLQGMDGRAWPEVTGYQAHMQFGDSRKWYIAAGPFGIESVKLAGKSVEHVRSEIDFEIASAIARNVIPPDVLAKTLALPHPLAPAVSRIFSEHLVDTGRHLPPLIQPLIFLINRNVPIWAPDVPPEDLQAHLEGKLQIRWMRAALLGDVPVTAGSRFARDGHSVQIRSASIAGNAIHLHLSLVRCESMLGTWSGTPFEADPKLTLCLANPVLGEIAVPTSFRQQDGALLDLLDLDSREVQAQYRVLGAQRVAPAPISPEWLADARLYILEKQEFGSSEWPAGMPFNGEAVTRWEH